MEFSTSKKKGLIRTGKTETTVRQRKNFGFISDFQNFVINDGENELTINADVPGLTDREIQVTFQNGSLRIIGEKKGGREENFDNFYYQENWSGSFSKTITLEPNVDVDKASAKCKDGKLEIIIPKTERILTHSKKIKIT